MRIWVFLKKVGLLWLPHDMIEQIHCTCLHLCGSPLPKRNALSMGTGNPSITFFCLRIMTLYFRLTLQNFKESWFPRSLLWHELADLSPFSVHVFSHSASWLHRQWGYNCALQPEMKHETCEADPTRGFSNSQHLKFGFWLVIEIYPIYIVTFYPLSDLIYLE
jgi:hypothetical protein